MNNNNSNSFQEPIIGDMGQYPMITFMIIIFVISIITLFNYLKKKPKLYGPIIAIILILFFISFILKFFHINIKKALMIISFIIIAIVISILILSQGEYINNNKFPIINPIINPITNEENEEEYNYNDDDYDYDNIIIPYSKIECFNNQFYNNDTPFNYI